MAILGFFDGQRRNAVETLCEKLSEYVAAGAESFMGAFVRAADDGTELLTRPDADSECCRAIPN